MKDLKEILNEAVQANIGGIDLDPYRWSFGHSHRGFHGWVCYGYILQNGNAIGFYELNCQRPIPCITLYVSEKTKKQWKDTKKRGIEVPVKEVIDSILNCRVIKRFRKDISDVFIQTYKDYVTKLDDREVYPRGISTEGREWNEFCTEFQRFTGERFAHTYDYYMDLEEPREVRRARQEWADLRHLV